MNCKLVIAQPHPEAPAGQPFGVAWNNARKWFATEVEAWEFRDECLDRGFRGVRVLGAPCNAMVIG